ncbi:MAG: PIN domain-containing protein [Burkholderiaceae bacterium]
MIVLDTNVLSELLRPAPDAEPLAWLGAQPRAALFTTTITRGELLYGIRLMPDRQRKARLQAAVVNIYQQARKTLKGMPLTAFGYRGAGAGRLPPMRVAARPD